MYITCWESYKSTGSYRRGFKQEKRGNESKASTLEGLEYRAKKRTVSLRVIIIDDNIAKEPENGHHNYQKVLLLGNEVGRGSQEFAQEASRVSGAVYF